MPRVRTLDGDFNPITFVLIPGRCVPGDGSRDASIALDERWHARDLRMLRDMGCTEGPDLSADVTQEPWFKQYRADRRRTVSSGERAGSPSRDLVEIIAGITGARASRGHEVPQPRWQSRDVPAGDRVDGHRRGLGLRAQLEELQRRRRNQPIVVDGAREGLARDPAGPQASRRMCGPQSEAGELSPSVSCSSAVAEALELPDTWSEVESDLVREVGDRALLGRS